MRHIAAVLIVFSLLYGCTGGEENGTFAFFAADQSQLGEVQGRLFRPDSFKKFAEPGLFEQNRVLWLAYRPVSPDFGDIYALSLSKKSLGWIEIDLKNIQLSREVGYIVDYYNDLEPGEYMLRIAHENRVIDSYKFVIVPVQDETFIDFSLPVSDETVAEEDDIVLNSR